MSDIPKSKRAYSNLEAHHEALEIRRKIAVELLTGEKMLRKGVDIGSQPSQNIGIVYPYRLDNYAKIVKAVKGYGRYTDDSYAIARTREELLELLDGLEKEAKEYGLIINRKKTRIVKLSSEFRQNYPEDQPEEHHKGAAQAEGLQAPAR